MKKLLLAAATGALMAGAAGAEDVKMGILLGYTGPLESLAGPMDAGAQLAMKEVSDSGKLLDGGKVTIVQADNTCADAAASVTVIAADAMHADAWATALTVMGAKTGLEFARRHALAARFVTRDGDRLREAMTAPFEAHLAR